MIKAIVQEYNASVVRLTGKTFQTNIKNKDGREIALVFYDNGETSITVYDIKNKSIELTVGKKQKIVVTRLSC